LRLCYFTWMFVQDVSGGDGVDVWPRRVGIVGAENIEDLLGALRSGEPGRGSRFDCRPIRPYKQLSQPSDDSRPNDKGELACRRHVDRVRRDKVGIAAAVGDCIDERSLRGTVVAEHVPRQVLDLRSAAG